MGPAFLLTLGLTYSSCTQVGWAACCGASWQAGLGGMLVLCTACLGACLQSMVGRAWLALGLWVGRVLNLLLASCTQVGWAACCAACWQAVFGLLVVWQACLVACWQSLVGRAWLVLGLWVGRVLKLLLASFTQVGYWILPQP